MLNRVYSGETHKVNLNSTMQIINKYFRRSVFDSEDTEAKTFMMMASSFAGIGFGNAGMTTDSTDLAKMCVN